MFPRIKVFSTFLFFAGALYLLKPLHAWSNPRPILNLMGSSAQSDIFTKMISDPSGNLHLFWVEQFADQPSEMYYSLRDVDWKTPVNIFVGENLKYFDATITSDWRVHLVWADNGVYYSSAYVLDAGRVNAWSKPVLLDERNPSYINLSVGENEEILVT